MLRPLPPIPPDLATAYATRNLPELAAHYATHAHLVRRWLLAAGIPVRGPGGQQGPKQPAPAARPPGGGQTLRALGAAELARRTGVGVDTVHRALAQLPAG